MSGDVQTVFGITGTAEAVNYYGGSEWYRLVMNNLMQHASAVVMSEVPLGPPELVYDAPLYDGITARWVSRVLVPA